MRTKGFGFLQELKPILLALGSFLNVDIRQSNLTFFKNIGGLFKKFYLYSLTITSQL